MTQRIARRCEDRFITTLLSKVSAARSARRIDDDEVSGDRIENGHGSPLPFKHTVNAVRPVSIKFY
jgi:hypothetical protein